MLAETMDLSFLGSSIDKSAQQCNFMYNLFFYIAQSLDFVMVVVMPDCLVC
jgi:hypothetical protein